MTLSRHIFFPLLFFVSVVISLLSFFFVETNYVAGFLVFVYFSFFPGFVLLLSLKIKHLDSWRTVVLAIGLSLSLLLLPGVLFNWIWFELFHSPPLEKHILLTFYFIITSILIGVGYYINDTFKIKIAFNFKKILQCIYFVIPPFITLTSIFGAYQLNNSETNILALVAVIGIACVSLISVFFHKYIDENFYPWQIYWYSLALLLSLSLRSMYVSGWDIQSEFKMFQVTNSFGVWSPGNWNHAYNACLSITLLPTMFLRLTAIPSEYIFKLLFQILFAFTPVILYMTFRKYFISIISFLAIIYVISQPLFIQPLTALIRQEIAYIFFVLMLFVLFKTKLSNILQGILFLVFGFSMVVSHYSTTYVTIIILFLTYIGLGVYRLTEKVPFIDWFYKKAYITSQIKFYRYNLNPLLVILLIAFTGFWYGYINNQLGQVQQVAKEGISRMNELFESDIESEETKKAITFLPEEKTTVEEINDYIQMILIKVDGDSYRLYEPETYEGLTSFPVNPKTVSPQFVSPTNRHFVIGLEILKQIFKLLVMLGPVYLFVFYFRKHSFPREYIVLCGFGIAIITVMTFHPSLGLSYNLSRFYLQLLFYLSLTAILLLAFVLYPLKKFVPSILGILVCVLFLYLTGVVYQFIGGEARMNFNNYGDDFNKFYVHKEELASASWLNRYVNDKSTVFADLESNLRISRIVDRSINTNVIPQLIYKDAYVYGSYANINNNVTIIHFGGKILMISFPQQFLEQNKDVVYSNGGSEIYR